MSASSNYTEEAGTKLVERCFAEVKRLGVAIDDFNVHKEKWDAAGISPKGLEHIRETVGYAAHRLAFLEMALKGLRFKELHDLQAYGRFVESKRKLEDLDIEELRKILR